MNQILKQMTPYERMQRAGIQPGDQVRTLAGVEGEYVESIGYGTCLIRLRPSNAVPKEQWPVRSVSERSLELI